MATRDQFLKQCWKNIINSAMDGHWIDNNIREAERKPDAPFADAGPAIKRLLDLGASRRDLSLILRFGAYEAVFETLSMLDDPGIDGDDEMLHESLLSADPSGLEGRPGSVL
jgi:hypothetical protein